MLANEVIEDKFVPFVEVASRCAVGGLLIELLGRNGPLFNEKRRNLSRNFDSGFFKTPHTIRGDNQASFGNMCTMLPDALGEKLTKCEKEEEEENMTFTSL